MNVIPLLTTLVTITFTAAVFVRYLRRRGPHLLMWSFGLLLYGLGTLAEAVLSLGFNDLLLRLWYLSGAMLTAAWLGQGTIHLLVRRPRIAWFLTGILSVVSLVSLALVLAAPLTAAAGSFQPAAPVSAQYKEILVRSSGITVLTVVLNMYGTIAMVGGAILSAYLFWRKRVLINRVIGNVLIAAGAMVPALGGSLIKLGLADILYVSELIGALLMFLGFYRATTRAVPEQKPVPEILSQ